MNFCSSTFVDHKDKETASRAFQFFNLNNEEDRQGLIELITGFLDKLTGGQTVDTRGHADGILESVWSAIQYLLDTFDGETRAVDLNTRFDIENFFENILEKILGYVFGNLLDNPQMTRKIEVETILELIPDFILEIIAGFIETPCLLVKLIAADNELLGDACEFFQNLE